MRFSYGIVDERKILLYKPQLFLKGQDLWVFSSADFQRWYGGVKECLDGLHQIDSWEMEKGNFITLTELNLAMGLINIISEEFEQLFDSEKESDSRYYISTLNEKYKNPKSSYTSDMKRCDTKIPVITPDMKRKHLMEIVEEATRENSRPRKR